MTTVFGRASLLYKPALPPTRMPWHDDPVLFAKTCIEFPAGSELTDYQADVLSHLVSHRRVAQRGPHGLGKSAAAAILVHWYALSRDAAGIDWKVITTAGAWQQLIRYLWPEIRLWAHRLRWDVIGREPYNHRTEMLTVNLNLKHGSAFAVASSDPALIEGAHAREILYIFDESKSINADTFDAAEGAFSVGEGYALASSTPGDPAGRFYDIHQRKRGYEDWWTRHVSKDEVIAAGRMNPDWAAQKAIQWGVDSAIYANRVEGEFHSSDTDAVIPLSWVEAAVQRWYEWYDSKQPSGPLTDLGVDVAREGSDQTVLAFRHGDLISELQYTSREDTMKTTGRAMAALGNSGARPVVDVIGVGGGVVDRLREQGIVVDAFTAGASTDLRDRSGEVAFFNCRSAAWWNLRELLDPAFGSQIALPDDDLLTGDLVSPKYEYTSKGSIRVEGKDDIRKRIGRSTDAADAVVQAFFPVKRTHRKRMIYYAQ